MFLSIVIPVVNEEKRIVETLKKISDFLTQKGYPYEIIVVDDASRDATLRLVNEFTLRNKHPLRIIENKHNTGKGHAVKVGVLESLGEYILCTDADLSVPIQEFEKLYGFCKEGYDIVIGSRGLPDSCILIHQPWYRERMGKIFNICVQMLLFKGISDTQCGFKVFKSEAAKRIFSKVKLDGFAFDAEVLFIAQKIGIRIKEVGINWAHSPASKVHLIKDSLCMLLDLFRIRLFNMSGAYNTHE